MKKTIFCLVAAMAVLACSKTEENEVTVDSQKPVYTLYGNIAQETGTKVAISPKDGGGFSHLWQTNDAISVFDNPGSEGVTYTVTSGSVGKSTGAFTGDTGVDGDFYAIYPDVESNAVAVNETVPSFTVTYPADQTLIVDSYDPAANVYVATGKGNSLTFYNTTAYLRLALYTTLESATVSKIELSTLDGTKIAGTGTVSLVTQDETTSVGTISISDTGSSDTITLSSTDGISISTSSANPTYFYVAVPAITYGDNFAGYQIKIYSDENTYQFRNLSTGSTAQPLVSNTVRLMSPLEYNPVASSTATLVTGDVLNKALKSLAAGSEVTDYKATDGVIQHIIIETNKNMTGYTGVTNQTVVSTSAVPIIASWNATTNTIRIQTAASKILTQSCASMFRSFTALTDITGFEGFIIGQSKSMAYMFMNSNNLKSVDLTNMSFENTSYSLSCTQMFAGCSALESVKFPNTTFYASGLVGVFQSCSHLNSVNNLNKIKTSSGLTSVSKMFYGCSNLTTLAFNSSYFTCSKVTDFSEMFNGCTNLQSISYLSAISPEGTNNINCSKMFYNCEKFVGVSNKRLALSGFGPSENITVNGEGMFYNCKKIESVKFKSAVHFSSTKEMFYGCSALTDPNLPNINTESTTDMSGMFRDCDAITSLDLSTLNTQNVTDMSNMFNSCDKLTTINLGGTYNSTAAITDPTKLTGFILNDNKITSLTLGDNFNFSSLNGGDIDSYFWPNPNNSNREDALIINCTKTTCQNLLSMGGDHQNNNDIRILTGINTSKFVFKTKEGDKFWTFWDEVTQCLPGDPDNPVKKTCTVGDPTDTI